MAKKTKYVVRRLSRNKDGTMGVVFVDTETGRVINDPARQGYEVVTAGQHQEQPKEDKKSKAKQEEKEDEAPIRNESDNQYEFKNFAKKAVKKSVEAAYPPAPVNEGVKPTQAVEAGVPKTSPSAGVEVASLGNDVFGYAGAQSSYDQDTDLEDRPRKVAELSYNMGPNRPNVPSSDIAQKVQDVVSDVLGSDYKVSLTSGQEDPGHQHGSNRHKTGLAGDFKISAPDGTPVTDPNTMKAVAEGMAARYGANIGFGPEYMGPSTMHIDTVDPSAFGKNQDAQWGTTGNAWAGDLNMAREQGVMPASYYDVSAPIPTSRDQAIAGPNEAIAEINFNRFNDDEKSLMAQTLAGEIDQRFTDLSTPEGYKEAMGILSTMENRAAKYGGVVNAIEADDQYSTWSTAQASNTALSNYNGNKEMFDNLVAEYEANPENNLGYTSYYNPSIVSPGWGTQMENAANIGPHRFGSLPEYASAGSFGTNVGSYGVGTPTASVSNNSTDTVRTTAGVGGSASGSVSLGGISGFDNSSGGMTSSENANRGFSSSSNSGSFSRSDGYSSAGTASASSDNRHTSDRSFSSGIGGSSSGGSVGSKSSVGSGFGSGTSGSGGGSYGGSGRSYSSVGSTSGGSSYGGGTGTGMSGTSGNAGKSKDDMA